MILADCPVRKIHLSGVFWAVERLGSGPDRPVSPQWETFFITIAEYHVAGLASIWPACARRSGLILTVHFESVRGSRDWGHIRLFEASCLLLLQCCCCTLPPSSHPPILQNNINVQKVELEQKTFKNLVVCHIPCFSSFSQWTFYNF